MNLYTDKLLAALIFFTVVFFPENQKETVVANLLAYQATPDLIKHNPFELSSGLILWVKNIEIGSKILVDPQAKDFLFAYRAVYVKPSPVRTVFAFNLLRTELSSSGSLYGAPPINLELINKQIEESGVNYLLLHKSASRLQLVDHLRTLSYLKCAFESDQEIMFEIKQKNELYIKSDTL